MKAAFVRKRSGIRINDMAKPEPGNGEILVRINACGLCGSDYVESYRWAEKWKRFGHEIAGTVEKTGGKIRGFKKGDQVTIYPSINCGTCDACMRNNISNCNNLIISIQEGFGEYTIIRNEKLLCKVSPQLPPEILCFAEPLSVILDAFENAGLKTSSSLFIVGGGFLGKLALLTARILNIPIFGVLSRRLDDFFTENIKKTEKLFTWNTLLGRTISTPVNLKTEFDKASSEIIVFHTAPAGRLDLYMDVLPVNTTVIICGISEKKSENFLKINFEKAILKKIKFFASCPIPDIWLPRAVKLLQNNRKYFSAIPKTIIGIDDLPFIFKKNRIRDKKIVVRF